MDPWIIHLGIHPRFDVDFVTSKGPELHALQGKENCLGHEFGIWIRFFLRLGLPLVNRSFTFLRLVTNIISFSFLLFLRFRDIHCNLKFELLHCFCSETIEKAILSLIAYRKRTHFWNWVDSIDNFCFHLLRGNGCHRFWQCHYFPI